MNLEGTQEGIGIAIDALRSNKVRAFLTILGIGIGVATVTGMASILTGVKQGISADLEAIGPENFVVSRFDQTNLRVITTGKPPWEGKPKLTLAEGAVIANLASVGTVTPAVQGSADIKYGTKELTGVMVAGLGADWTGYRLGDFSSGRNFFPADVNRSAPVAVLSHDLATQLFGHRAGAGERIRLGAEVYDVVGVYKAKPNLFDPGPELWAYIPATTAFKNLLVNDDWVELWVVPERGYDQARTMDDVTVALRSLRRLKPSEENNFALVRQEAFADLLDSITGKIQLVMLVLASIGLMVGGVGVVGIMLISVTERTREIGVRKALGATRGQILWQFLVESMTVTVIGGAFGLLFGAGGALLLSAVTPIPAEVPLWAIGAALAASAITGIGFGLYPANKAAKLDPVEALRYE